MKFNWKKIRLMRWNAERRRDKKSEDPIPGRIFRSEVYRFCPDPEEGLRESDVQERLDAGWNNAPVDSATQTVGEIIRSNTFTYFNLIFAILAVLLAVVGSFRDMTFLGVIFCNTLIGILQEIRSKKVLDELNFLNAARAKVIRDGQLEEILVEDLVIDDIIELKAGSQIPADAQVVSGSVQVNEALLTGESDEITKREGHKLLSGSFVVSGECRAVLTQVGEDSYISKLTLEATTRKGGEQSEMIRSLDKLVKIVGVIIIPIGMLLFYQQFFVVHASFRESITSMVAAVIGMIPEGLYLTASIAMAVSAMRLAKQQVLLHDMKCIETLARVTVLCVDKTGTITEDRMEVKGLLLPGEGLSGDYSGNNNEAVLSWEDGSPGKDEETPSWRNDSLEVKEETPSWSNESKEEKQRVYNLLCEFVQGMTADNSTMKAMKEYFRGGTGRIPEQIIPFSSRVKYSGAVIDGQSYVLGAPEFILGERYESFRQEMECHGEAGYRVLAFGTYPEEITGEPLNQSAELLGIVLLANRIRKGAVDTFRYFAERDVEIKVISGDNPVSVSAIAKEAGIQGAEEYVDASLLETEQQINDAVKKYTVFGRVTPDQKRQFVQALQKQGETVAMTGDGVNDVLALKDADCSIAMASGSEAASQVAQLVLLDSDFSKMPSVVMEGRRVVNNIERTASLFLVKNIFSLLLSVFSVILVMDYPLEAAQVSLIGMFTIGIPAFILSQEPNKNPIRGNFLSNVFLRALPAGLTDFAVVLGLVLFCQEFNVDSECMSTACTLLVSLVGFMIMYRIMSPMTKIHWAIFISMIVGLTFCMLKVSWFFAITGITHQVAMLMVLFGIIAEPMMRYLGQFTAWAERKLTERSERGRAAWRKARKS
ncbi:MAG: cation-translocating P-type ATPase [Clostridiales bacterium]|nr:cation-translocating P-type ATPase [Clostridiales bacterium]